MSESKQFFELVEEISTVLKDVYSESYHLSENQLLALYVNDGRDVMNSFSIRYNYALSNDSHWFICRSSNNPHQIQIYNMRNVTEAVTTIDFDNKIDILRIFFLPNSMYAAVLVVDSKGLYFFYVELDSLKRDKQVLAFTEINSKLRLAEFRAERSKVTLRSYFNTQDIFINFSTSLDGDESDLQHRGFEVVDPRYLHIGISTKLPNLRYALFSVELNMLSNPLSQQPPRTPPNSSRDIQTKELRKYFAHFSEEAATQQKISVTDNSSFVFAQTAPSEYSLMKIEFNMIERLRKRKQLTKQSHDWIPVAVFVGESGILLKPTTYSNIVLQPDESPIEATGGNPLHLYVNKASSICYIDVSDPALTRQLVVRLSQEQKVWRIAFYHNTLLEVVVRDGFINYLNVSGQYFLYYQGVDQILHVSKRLDHLIRRSSKKQLYKVPMNLPAELLTQRQSMIPGIACDKRGLQIFRQHVADPAFNTNRWIILHPVHQGIYLDLASSFISVDQNRVTHSIHSPFIFAAQEGSLYVANFINRLVYIICGMNEFDHAVMSDDGFHVILFSAAGCSVVRIMDKAAVLMVASQAAVPKATLGKQEPDPEETIMIDELAPIIVKKRTTKKKLTNIFLSAPPTTIHQEMKFFSTVDSTYILTAERTSDSMHKGQMSNVTVS